MTHIDRRGFLYRSALASAGTLAASRLGLSSDSPLTMPRVVHVHHGRAARWPRVSGYYRDFVDQAAVSAALDQAVAQLKGTGIDQAWRQVFPLADASTRKLSIKISLNNSTDAVIGAGNDIDAVPEPAIAVMQGFVRAGGLSSNVNIYDGTDTTPTRYIATWFKDKVRAVFPDALFNAPWSVPPGCDARKCVSWDAGWGVNRPVDTAIKGAVLNADYVVNIPIVKRHGQANVSLGFKNHFGSISRCDNLHSYVFNDTPAGSVLADIMGSPIVAGDPTITPLYRKTVLTVGDMLFGQPCRNWGATPRPWALFGNEWPNSLIVSDDVVAADSVMFDLLDAEPASDGGCGSVRSWARRYLQIAESRGQGVHEHVVLPVGQRFNPSNMAYTKLDYRWLDVWSSGAALTVSRMANGAVLLEWQHYFPGLCQVHRASRPDLSDELIIGTTPAGKYIDPNPPNPAYYWIRFIG